MCEPATLTLVGMGLSAAMTAGSMIMQGQAQAAQANHERQIARQNEQLAKAQADDALVRSKIEQRDIAERGRIEEQRYRIQASQLISQNKSALAASGVLLEDGTSAAESLIDSRATAELDAQTIKSNTKQAIFERAYTGEQEAFGHKIQSVSFANQQSALAAQAKNARTAGFFQAGTTLLSGASKVGGKFREFKRQGAFD